MQIKNILVPVDFSQPSRMALTHAIALSRILHTRLTLLHVVESPTTSVFPLEAAKVQKKHYIQAKRLLPALLTSKERQDPNIKMAVRSGNIEQEILSVADEDKSDLIVMGAHGRGLFGRWLIGSVTEGVLRKAWIPVLTVGGAGAALTVNRILFAMELPDSWKEGSGFVLEFAQMANANLIGLHVIEVEAEGGAEAAEYLHDSRVAEARAKMDEFRTMASEEEIAADTVLMDGVAGTAILEAGQQKSADVLALTIQRGSLTPQNFIGTTAAHVIREAQVPVLSIPIGGEAAQEEAPAA
jgi:universal stress protein A